MFIGKALYSSRASLHPGVEMNTSELNSGVSSTMDHHIIQAVWVRALAGDTVLYSWTRHLTVTVLLSTQDNKWVQADSIMLGPCDGLMAHFPHMQT